VQEGTIWFICQGLVAAIALACGFWFARGPGRRCAVAVLAALALLALWAWLQRHPSVLVQAVPVHILRYFEGTGAVPLFMFIMGVVCQRSALPRQKGLAGMAVCLGVLYFLYGGLWMVQTTPARLLQVTSVADQTLQSEHFSCVPAACATALNRLGVPASEGEMAGLTDTRRGSGATLIRAMDALQSKLSSRQVKVVLAEPRYEKLRKLPMPALALLQPEALRRHMVVLDAVGAKGVTLFDPQIGQIFMSRRAFERMYCGQVLAFSFVPAGRVPARCCSSVDESGLIHRICR